MTSPEDESNNIHVEPKAQKSRVQIAVQGTELEGENLKLFQVFQVTREKSEDSDAQGEWHGHS